MARKFKAYTDGRYIYEIKEVVPKTWYIVAYLLLNNRKGNVHRMLGKVDAKAIKREHWRTKYIAQSVLELTAQEKGWMEFIVKEG